MRLMEKLNSRKNNLKLKKQKNKHKMLTIKKPKIHLHQNNKRIAKKRRKQNLLERKSNLKL